MLNKHSPSRYRLKILQQPVAARACGHGERDRRVIDPPPILQLSLADFDPDSSEDVAALKVSLNVVQCLLYSVPDKNAPPTAGEDVTQIPDTHNPGKFIRRLMGNLVANSFVGTDPKAPLDVSENARIGVFFIFHDLSCRQNGLYRLHFKLTSLAPAMITSGSTPIVATAISDIFEVLSAKEFPGMQASSPLTIELKAQGATVNVKKGSEAKAAKRNKKRASGSEGSVTE